MQKKWTVIVSRKSRGLCWSVALCEFGVAVSGTCAMRVVSLALTDEGFLGDAASLGATTTKASGLETVVQTNTNTLSKRNVSCISGRDVIRWISRGVAPLPIPVASYL